jgi:hypothetical protein
MKTARKKPLPLLEFEHRDEPLLPRREFLKRMGKSGAIAAMLISISLAAGVAGYHWMGRLDWTDALLNASMILGGMGPVDPLPSDAAKIFASVYALYSGFALITSVSVFLSPAVHRLMHHFHLEVGDG